MRNRGPKGQGSGVKVGVGLICCLVLTLTLDPWHLTLAQEVCSSDFVRDAWEASGKNDLEGVIEITDHGRVSIVKVD